MPESTPPSVDVSVLVPVLNEGRNIREAVEAMTAQRFDGSVEFLFADGRSSDDTRLQLEELAREDPRIRVLDNPRRGTASGLNVCLREARGTYVARMDAHTFYPERYLQLGVQRLRQGQTDVAWVAGPQAPQAAGPVSTAVVAALGTWLGRGGSRRWAAQDARKHPAGQAAAASAQAEYDLDTGVFCGVWRREDVLAHGGWDEGWPRNQDSEMAARFLAGGQRIVCLPDMAARYIPRDSIGALWRQYRDYGQYRARTARRHPHSLRRSAVLPPLVALDCLLALVAPAPVRRGARLGLSAYGAALLAAALQAIGRRARCAYLVPLVLATMHLAHGVGFIEGSLRWGAPWRALLGLLTGRRQSKPYAGPIEAPSLRAE